MFRLRPILTAVALKLAALLLYMLLLLVVYFAGVRDYQMNWGATADEIARPMVGDDLHDQPRFNATRAVTINAPPAEVWPWIVQMGYKRGGFYGFDKLDNGGFPSSDSILPEYQTLQPGDSIPGGEHKGRVFYLMEVAAVAPNEAMLWVFAKGTPWQDATWSWGLYATDDGGTRLVSRLRQNYTFDSFQEVVSWSMIDAIEILMMRTTLLGIRRRAERL